MMIYFRSIQISIQMSCKKKCSKIELSEVHYFGPSILCFLAKKDSILNIKPHHFRLFRCGKKSSQFICVESMSLIQLLCLYLMWHQREKIIEWLFVRKNWTTWIVIKCSLSSHVKMFMSVISRFSHLTVDRWANAIKLDNFTPFKYYFVSIWCIFVMGKLFSCIRHTASYWNNCKWFISWEN